VTGEIEDHSHYYPIFYYFYLICFPSFTCSCLSLCVTAWVYPFSQPLKHPNGQDTQPFAIMFFLVLEVVKLSFLTTLR